MSDPVTILDLNTAGRDELTNLPGIGPEIAERILAARPFLSPEDVQRVSGIGPVLFSRILPYITVSAIPTELAGGRDEGSAPPEVESERAEMEMPETTFALEEAKAEPERMEAGAAEPVPAPEGQPIPEEESEAAAPSVTPVTQAGFVHPETHLEAQAEQVEEGAQVPPEPGVSQAEFVQAEAPAEPAAQVQPVKQPKTVTRAGAFWIAFGSGFFALVLAVVFSLGLLVLLNGGLQYVSPAQLNTLKSQADSMSLQLNTMQQDMNGLRTRVDNLEGLSGRISTVEQNAKQLRSDMDSASSQLDQFGQQMDGLTSDIKDLQTRTGLFQNFLNGLQELLNQVTQP